MYKYVELVRQGDPLSPFAIGDFFALTAEDLAHCDGFYDRAALIAMNDAMRADYATHMATILRPGATGLTITIEYAPGKMQGPPFSVSDATVQALYGPHFEIEACAYASGPDRLGNLAERGLDTLEERVYRMARRGRKAG